MFGRNEDNPILLSDSYKVSHAKQYPPGTTSVYSYFESRGGEFPRTVFFGLQYLLRRYLSIKIVQDHVEEAESYLLPHMGHFNRAGWEHIIDDHGGYLPVVIKAVPEGTVVPTHNVLMTIENTCPQCFWLTNYIETLLVQVWYPTTVATLSREAKKIIAKWMDKNSDSREGLEFKLHDFGVRGSTSMESAAIGGGAHLVNFRGTDNIPSLKFSRENYGEEMAGNSIPASEHSTITSWGKEHEVDAFRNMLEQYPTGIVACVSDSFSITDAVEKLWGEELHDDIVKRDGTLVVRPDSGDPSTTVVKVLKGLGRKFGYTKNSKGSKVLPDYIRVIQGDGCDLEEINNILRWMDANGWSATNVAFGMGGGLLQKLDRDTCMWAFKCSAVVVDGEFREVWKSPEGSEWKASKPGRMALVEGYTKSHTTVSTSGSTSLPPMEEDDVDLLQVVFENGKLKNKTTLAEVRERAAI